MTPEETAHVLAKCVAFDRRTVGRADVLAWHEVLGDLPYSDVLAAVGIWYRDSREWLMPSDVRDIALRLDHERRRDERLALEAAEERRLAIAATTTEERAAEVAALIEQLRATLPAVPSESHRRREVVAWERQRRLNGEAPNPHFDPEAAQRLAEMDRSSTLVCFWCGYDKPGPHSDLCPDRRVEGE